MKSRLPVCLAALCWLFCACNPGKHSDLQVFSYNEASGLPSLDPAFAKNQQTMWAVHQLYNTLVEVDSALHIVPSVARSWELSADRMTYTFHLRREIYFQDDPVFPDAKGRHMTASDVVFSLQRILDPATASSGAWIFNGKTTSAQMQAPDDSTFILQLNRPFQPMLGILSMQYCSIVAPEAVRKYGIEFRRHPVGTGPFRMRFWEEGQSLVLEKNHSYWERDEKGIQLPYLDLVQVHFYDNKASEFLEFQQGRLNFINDIDASFKDEVLTRQGDLRREWKGRVVLQKYPYLNTEYFGILMDSSSPLIKKSPLRLKAVREAINYAIDRRQLLRYMRNSIGIPAEAGFAPAGLPSRNAEMVKGYTYQPEKARQLLTAAGITGHEAAIKLTTMPIYADVASFVARQLENAGLNVRVEVIQKSLLMEETAKSDAAFFRGSWIADYPDAENYMAVFYSKNPAPPNYTRYKNEVFDRMYEHAISETNDSTRYALYRSMDSLVMRDAPVVPVFYDESIHMLSPEVRGLKPNALNMLELRRVRIAVK